MKFHLGELLRDEIGQPAKSKRKAGGGETWRQKNGKNYRLYIFLTYIFWRAGGGENWRQKTGKNISYIF